MKVATSITVRVPLTIRRRPGRKTVVTPEGGPATTPNCARSDPALVKALARAHRWKRMLDEGRYASISEVSTAERLDRGYVGRTLQLTLLAPDIVEAILDGRQVTDLRLPALLEPLPLEWERQRRGLCGPQAVAAPRQHPSREPLARIAGDSANLFCEENFFG